MKKGLAILLALGLCVMLSGCSQEERAQRSYEILVKLGDRQPTPEPSATPEASATPAPSATPETSTTPEADATLEASATPNANTTPEAGAMPEMRITPEPGAVVEDKDV